LLFSTAVDAASSRFSPSLGQTPQDRGTFLPFFQDGVRARLPRTAIEESEKAQDCSWALPPKKRKIAPGRRLRVWWQVVLFEGGSSLFFPRIPIFRGSDARQFRPEQSRPDNQESLMPTPSPDPTWHIENYRPLLRLLAWQMHLDPRLQRRFDGSDVVNEALLRAVTNFSHFDGTTKAQLISWLHKILANTFRDMVRKEMADRRSPKLEASFDAIEAESSRRLDLFIAANQSTPSAQMERKEFSLRWAGAVEQLPRDQRDVVFLRDGCQLSIQAIAERLGKTEKAVAGLLLRGRQALRPSFLEYAEP
jgi:RNA polymerase sigma-70 factor (ECF subfamily)